MYSLIAFLLSVTIHVPGDSSTIQKGMNGLTDNDTLEIAAGTYYEANLSRPDMDYIVFSGDSAHNTIIDAQQNGSVFDFYDLNTTGHSYCTWEDLTLKHGKDDLGGGIAFYIFNSATFRRLIFDTDSAVSFSGGGFHGNKMYGTLRIENCLFNDCYGNSYISTSGGGLGINVWGGKLHLYVENCTFWGCTGGSAGKAIAITRSDSGFAKVVNTIMWNCGNGAAGDVYYTVPYGVAHSTDSLLYCDADTSAIDADVGIADCIELQPLFADSLNGNFQLTEGSPCVDSGTVPPGISASLDLLKVSRPENVWDMGAYEYIPVGGGQIMRVQFR